ncbi:hypothetical protein WN51_11242 [Melipona quadrifasciata]|uniref:Uncharacterized protein n=1 Tax=Melipona quadrifasciata TaxID=166423 RepID=A0A0M9A632_9HYME|nr:hypothetical protein WN51_11242 [Melipona quadrifasciata]
MYAPNLQTIQEVQVSYQEDTNPEITTKSINQQLAYNDVATNEWKATRKEMRKSEYTGQITQLNSNILLTQITLPPTLFLTSTRYNYAQYQTTPLLPYPTPPRESRDPNQPIANFRCIRGPIFWVTPAIITFSDNNPLPFISQSNCNLTLVRYEILTKNSLIKTLIIIQSAKIIEQFFTALTLWRVKRKEQEEGYLNYFFDSLSYSKTMRKKV